MSAIGSELTNLQNNTAVNKANQQKANGPSQELDQDAFLMLMLEQLKQQDPLNPMDNSEMLAQQAQFTQISELQKLNDSINANNMIVQASSLVGKTVQIVDPENPAHLITGVVTSANFSSQGATVTVNGKNYPLGLVTTITDGAPVSDSETINNKKLGELNNANITDGAITVTITDKDGKDKNHVITVNKDMTVDDLRKKFKELGIESEIVDGTLVFKKGDFKAINISNGDLDNPSIPKSNFVGAVGAYVDDNGNIVTGILDFNRGGSSSGGNGGNSSEGGSDSSQTTKRK